MTIKLEARADIIEAAKACIAETRKAYIAARDAAKQAKTGVLDAFFDAWDDWQRAHPDATFRDWVANDYDAAAVRASFKSNFWANQLVDRILRRE